MKFTPLSLAAASLFLLAACGPGKTETASPAQEETAAPAPAPSANETAGQADSDIKSPFRPLGDAAAPLLTGEWIVEDIAGGGVIDNSRATLVFAEDGRASGSASCNSYSSSYTLDGKGLSFGPAAVTRKMCAPALMDQEQKFLNVLENAQSFEIDKSGALIISGDDSARLVARKTTG